MSFNPATGLVYIPAVEGSFPYAQERDFKRQNGFWNMGIDLNARGSAKGLPPLPEKEYEPGTGPEVGSASLLAWDPVAGKPRWRIKHQGVSGGGTLTTAGNLLFQGLSDGRLVAYTADTGDKVWEVQLGNGVIAAPSTWSMDGKQYVSVLVGWGGATGLYVGNPTRQFKAPGRLFTFVLDGTAKLEPVRGIEHDPLTPVAYKATAAQLEHGSALFARRCSMCHGTAAASGGTIADLRYAQPATYDNMDQIVRQGKALYVGISQYPAELTARAVEILNKLGTPLLIHQPRYSMLDRWVENGLLDVIGREGVGSIAFSPLEQGVLTDRYLNGFPEDSRAMRDGRYLNQGKISPERLEIARKLNVIAKERGQSLAQMAIAWLLKDPRITSVLIGASSPQQVLDNVGALANLHFSEANLAEIEKVLKG